MTKCTNQNKDHPRLCGEKLHEAESVIREEGSPPPMRGKDLLVVQPCTANGITPAYAGKSVENNAEAKAL